MSLQRSSSCVASKEIKPHRAGSDLVWGRCQRHGVLLWSWWGSGCAPPCAAKSGRPLLDWQALPSRRAQGWRQGWNCWLTWLHWRRRENPPADPGHFAQTPYHSPCPSSCYWWMGCGRGRIIYLRKCWFQVNAGIEENSFLFLAEVISRHHTLVWGARLIGDFRQGVPSLSKSSWLIGWEQVGRIILCVGLLSLNTLVDRCLHHVARRRGRGLAEDSGGRKGVQQAAVHLWWRKW